MALLALELFEVITIRVVDALQQIIRSPQLPQRIQGLRTRPRTRTTSVSCWSCWTLGASAAHPGGAFTTASTGGLAEPCAQQSDQPDQTRHTATTSGLLKAESELGRQLASGVIDSLLDLSRTTGSRLGQHDQALDQLGTDALDRFGKSWPEFWMTGLCWNKARRCWRRFWRTSSAQASVSCVIKGVDDLINELDGLNFSPSTGPAKPL